MRFIIVEPVVDGGFRLLFHQAEINGLELLTELEQRRQLKDS